MLFDTLKQPIYEPTLKQKEAYARFFHTLSAASIIGMVSIIFTESSPTFQVVVRIIGLLLSAVLCFFAGAILSKGE